MFSYSVSYTGIDKNAQEVEASWRRKVARERKKPGSARSIRREESTMQSIQMEDGVINVEIGINVRR
jgi:hypothetical protein